MTPNFTFKTGFSNKGYGKYYGNSLPMTCILLSRTCMNRHLHNLQKYDLKIVTRLCKIPFLTNEYFRPIIEMIGATAGSSLQGYIKTGL